MNKKAILFTMFFSDICGIGYGARYQTTKIPHLGFGQSVKALLFSLITGLTHLDLSTPLKRGI